jgi:hypothetical protein
VQPCLIERETIVQQVPIEDAHACCLCSAVDALQQVLVEPANARRDLSGSVGGAACVARGRPHRIRPMNFRRGRCVQPSSQVRCEPESEDHAAEARPYDRWWEFQRERERRRGEDRANAAKRDRVPARCTGNTGDLW